MCVWITAESVFQCLGTDTFCPTSAPSLVPGNMLEIIPWMIQAHFQQMLVVFDCVNYASAQLSILFYVIFVVWILTKWSVVSSERSDSGRIPVLGLNGILRSTSTHGQVRVFLLDMGHVHPDRCGHG